jgi:hypothetical protein
MTLLEWSRDLPEWQRDALRRIATSETLRAEDHAAISARLKHAHGIAVNGDTACVPLAEAQLAGEAGGGEAAVLCGIGPVQHVDRLADDQELRFGVNGITLIYGDNGTGKSGYARVAKKLCLARVVDALQGDVFAEQNAPLARVRVRYRLPSAAEPQTDDWVDGQPRPAALARMMVLDSVNTKVYVDKHNEIIYLPREIEIATRLGDLCSELGSEVQHEADAIAQRCRGLYGVGYAATTPAGQRMRRLIVESSSDALPSEASLRDAASWDEQRDVELRELTRVLAQDPAALAAARRRVIEVLDALSKDIDDVIRGVSDEALNELVACMADVAGAEAAAGLAARERFANEPIGHTGQGAWERLYRVARQFASEARIRVPEEPFQPGDPCPVCQSSLDEEAALRLQRFDDFIHGAAANAVATARVNLETMRARVTAVRVPNPAGLDRSMAEYRGLGEAAVQIAADVRAFMVTAEARRQAALAATEPRHIGGQPALPNSPIETLRTEIARLTNEAAALEAQPGQDPGRVSRAEELRDAQRLAGEMDVVLARRAELDLRLRLLNCRASLDTRGISQFATRRRRELVTPELRDRINAEFHRLDLGHVPLRFAETTEHGRSYFDVMLDARRQVAKARVLSEGEQRALGIACFFAEVGRVPGHHGIIVDDPVSSLDHHRLRKVAERLVGEAAAGRQVIVFTHHLVFYQEMLAAAAAHVPQVPAIVNLIGKADGRFGIVSENDKPWIAKKVADRISALRERLGEVPANMNRDSDAYRRLAKDFYTDLRETWERLVEEVLLNSVVERFCSGVKTQSLREVLVDDADYQVIFANMKRVSEFSGHDMAAGRQIPVPDPADMGRDLDALANYRTEVRQRRNVLRARREQLEQPPAARVE